MACAGTTFGEKLPVQRRKSYETVCSSNSSCTLHKRKPVHPLARSIRTYVTNSTSNNSIKQRVLSARLLKLRSLQNQLNDVNFHLSELQQENKALRNLQTRQDKALSRYEGTNADLPKLLKSHEEEIRILTAKNKTLRKSTKDVTEQLKFKEEELASVREQLRNLSSLTKNKNLGERQALAEEVRELKEKLKISEDNVNLLNRKLMLETKNYKYKLNVESSKSKQGQKELAYALEEINRLAVLVDIKGKRLPQETRKITASNRQSVSLTNLLHEKSAIKRIDKLTELSEEPRITVRAQEDSLESSRSDIKLETIPVEQKVTFSSDIMTSPSESIKARLSANGIKKIIDVDQMNKHLEKLSLTGGNVDEEKLQKLIATEHNVKRLGNSCDNIRTTVNECNAFVDKHKENFEIAQSETEKLLKNLYETDTLNSKLRYSNFLASDDKVQISEQELAMAKKIWKEEYNFRKENESDNNGNDLQKGANFVLENKNKLLATLRAIDNGEELEDKYEAEKFYRDLTN